jgi:two-component system, LytTR family, sensor kinase
MSRGLSPTDIEYQLQKAASPGQESHETDSLWRTFPSDTSAFPLHIPRGNTYDLALRYKFQRETIVHYTIAVSRYWWSTTWFLVTLCTALGAAVIFWSFVSYRSKKERQWAIQEGQKKRATQALRSVQAQLNPHFIFNALTSIQGLVNTGDIDGANRYLSEFSLLMRHTLSEQDQILNRLGMELASMETYLRLEQLRFHFGFSFHVDPSLLVDELEIPRLLLQPVIENAVKHGVSGLRENGYIRVSVHADSPHLTIDIRDNGPGFRPAIQEGAGREPGASYGLRLTADRIRLLNQLQPETPIELTRADGSGTTFTFTFKNWLA